MPKRKLVASQVFWAYPHALELKCTDNKVDRLGKATLHGGGRTGQRGVANLFAQRAMSKNGRNRFIADDKAPQRKERFRTALEDFARQAKRSPYAPFESVAFPEKIGCGVAGGEWAEYKQIIEAWAEEHAVDVSIVRWDGRSAADVTDQIFQPAL